MTTHTHLLSEMEVQGLCTSIGMAQGLVSCYLLQEFDTEQDFSNKVGYVQMCCGILVTYMCTSGGFRGLQRFQLKPPLASPFLKFIDQQQRITTVI